MISTLKKKTKSNPIDVFAKINELTNMWDSIPDKENILPVPTWHKRELKKRHQQIAKHPEKLISEAEFEKQYLSRV